MTTPLNDVSTINKLIAFFENEADKKLYGTNARVYIKHIAGDRTTISLMCTFQGKPYGVSIAITDLLQKGGSLPDVLHYSLERLISQLNDVCARNYEVGKK